MGGENVAEVIGATSSEGFLVTTAQKQSSDEWYLQMQLSLRTRLDVSLWQLGLQLMDTADNGLVTDVETTQHGWYLHHLSEPLVTSTAEWWVAFSDAVKFCVKSCHIVADSRQLP